jgi:hypothetical protein
MWCSAWFTGASNTFRRPAPTSRIPMEAVLLDQTRRHVRVLMREGRALMQDVVATYHEVAASRNWFQQPKDLLKGQVSYTELTQVERRFNVVGLQSWC